MRTTILIVDDQPTNRQYLVDLLMTRGYRTREAGDGAEALDRVRAELPDLIITDILMPTMDGYELVRRLRGDPVSAAIPVLFCTGAYDPEEIQRLTETGGIIRLMTKPVRAKEILRQVETALCTPALPTSPEQWEAFDREHLRLLANKLFQKVQALEQEVEERRIAEKLRRGQEVEAQRLNTHLRTLLESTGEGIYGIDLEGRCTFINRVGAEMLGYTPEELIGRSMQELAHPDTAPGWPSPFDLCPIDPAPRGGTPCRVAEVVFQRKNGDCFPAEHSAFPVMEGDTVQGAVVTLRDITDRKQAEKALRAGEQFLQLVMDNIPLSVFWKDNNAVYQGCNRSYAQLVGLTTPAEILGKKDEDFRLKHSKSDLFRESDQLVMEMDMPILNMIEPVRCANGTHIQADISKLPLHDEDGRVVGLLGTMEDITERIQIQEQLQCQFARFNALRTIDSAILGSMDLRITLNLMVEQAVAGLDCHAARILLLTPYTHMLEFAAGWGFTVPHAAHTRLRLGEGPAGRAALDRRPVTILNLNETEEIFEGFDVIEADGFLEYHAVPLISKGIVQGVLEVFDRDARSRDTGWQAFLEMLASQAAIAIDNFHLFNDLQRTNAELVVAYDTTLEGWVKALDMRDQETDGHTMRVTDLTLALAKALGIRDQELAHVRRGALLHDIGKLAIPDHILQKPQALTEDEAAIMRRHPEFAHQWLRPIPFLRPALDIPYCHHEKWDGTGYPRGLAGEDIPLAARIFSVIDVWDALCSDRPYRQGWPEEKTLDHLRAHAGTHFDPTVVEAFLKLRQG